jgi:hypothetical protein
MSEEQFTIRIPGAFLNDADEALGIMAEEGNEAIASLLRTIEGGTVRYHGPRWRGGYSVTVTLNASEWRELLKEAEYRNEYWNTDAYGIKEGGSTIPAYASAARTLLRRMKEMTA